MATVEDIRTKFPDIAELDDNDLVDVVHKAYYSDMSRADVAKAFGVKPAAEPQKPRTLGGTLKDAGISLLKGAIAVPEAAVGVADIATGGRAGKLAEEAGFRPKDAKAILDENLSDQQKQANKNVASAEGLGETFMAAVQNPSVVAHSVVESLPSMLAGGAVARGGMALVPKLGAVAAGALGEGVVGAGSAAEQIRQQTGDGLLTGTQAALAGATGVATAGFAMLGGKIAQKLGIADVDTMLAGAAKNPVVAKGVVRSTLEGAVSEGILEELPQSVSEQVLQNIALDKPIEEGVDQAAVLGLLAGAAMGGGANVVNSLSGQPEPVVQPAPVIADPKGPMARAANVSTPLAAAGLPVEGEAAPVEPEPLVDPVMARIQAIGDLTARSEALAAYNIQNREDAPKGVKAFNKTLLNDILRDKSGPMLIGSITGKTGADLLQEQETDPLLAAARHSEEKKAAKEAAGQSTRTSAAIESGAELGPRGQFKTAQEAQDFISNQRRGASINLPPALPVEFEDGSHGVAVQGTPNFEEATRQANARRLLAAGVQEGDLLNPLGEPFKTRMAASRTAKTEGGEVLPVTGGFVVRPKQEKNNVSGTSNLPSSPAATTGSGTDNALGGVATGLGNAGADGSAVEPGTVRTQPAGDAVSPVNGRNDKAVDDQNTAPGAPAQTQAKTGQAPKARKADEAGTTAAGAKAGAGAVEADGVDDIDALEAALRKERDSTSSQIENDWVDGKGRRRQTAIERAIYDALAASVLDADAAASIVDTALKEGRTDLAMYAAKRAVRAANSMLTTPGVSESSPKYESIKKNLVEQKQKAQADAQALLEKVTKGSGPAQASGVAPSVKDLALQEQRDAGWNTDWPFVPADLGNADFRALIANDPDMAQAEKDQIFAAGKKLGVVPQNETLTKSAPAVPAPAAQAASDNDPTRQKALDRIAKGTAYFGTESKAKDFIAANGLSDTHEVAKSPSGANKWDVVAKSAVKQEVATVTEKTPQAAKSRRHLPNVVVMNARDRDGNTLGEIIEKHDGTNEGIVAAALRAQQKAYDELDASGIQSLIGATDDKGKGAWVVSPNAAEQNQVLPADSRMARAMWGDEEAMFDEFVAQKQAKEAVKSLPSGTAPEHVSDGVDDRELGEIVQEFNDAQEAMVNGDEKVTHVFDPPAKSEIVRLGDKVKVYQKDKGWMTVAEAKASIEEWKAKAKAQGKNAATNGNANRIVLSLFDLTGSWSKPWEEAGYQVYRFDIQADPDMGDVNKFDTEFFQDNFGSFEGQDIYAILAACPCTDFAVSGARHFAAKDKDGRTVASVKLVHQALATVEYFKPAVWAVENPVGRIEKLGGLPPWRLSFNPNHLGDPYTKMTLLWGRFNADLPIAPVEPTEGSKMHKLYGGKSMKTKNARSETPEGFSYGFFLANNAVDNAAMAIANKYDRLDRQLIEKAVAAGVTEQQISEAVDDAYYFDLDDEAANQAIRDLIESPPTGDAAGESQAPELVKIRTLEGVNTYVRKSDLDGDAKLLRMFTATGKNNGRIHRENLDPTGEKQAADNAKVVDNPFFAVITTKEGKAFTTLTSAQRELKKRALTDSHEVVPASEVRSGATGFVVRRKAAPVAAPAKPDTQRITTDKAEMRPYRRADGSVGYEAVPIANSTTPDPEPAQRPGTVKVPAPVEAALAGQMQKQKGRITRLKNEATKSGSLEDKRAAQLKVTAAETTLRKMRTSIFDAEDAAVKAVDTKDASAFAAHADIFPDADAAIKELLGQNDELDAETRSYEAKANPTYSGEPAQRGPKVVINKLGKDGLTDAERAAGKAPYNTLTEQWNDLVNRYKTADDAGKAIIKPAMDLLDAEIKAVQRKVLLGAKDKIKADGQERVKEEGRRFDAMPAGSRMRPSEFSADQGIFWEKTSADEWTARGDWHQAGKTLTGAEMAERGGMVAMAAKPATYTEQAHMIVGAMLPIWDRMKTEGTLRVARTQTTDGQRLLGRVIATKDIADIRKRLNIQSAASKMPPSEIMARILRGDVGELANGWTMVRAKVSDDLRIELKAGYLSEAAKRELVGLGVMSERIQWQDRFFIPTGKSGVPVLEALFKSKPLVDLANPKAKDADGENIPFSRSAPKPLKAVPTRRGTAYQGDDIVLGNPLLNTRQPGGDVTRVDFDLRDPVLFAQAIKDGKTGNGARDFAHVGVLTLDIGKDGKIKALRNIDIFESKRGSGFGEKTVGAIMATLPPGSKLHVYDILPKAVGFWDKMGAKFPRSDDFMEAYLSPQQFKDAYDQRTARAGAQGNEGQPDAAPFSRADEGRNRTADEAVRGQPQGQSAYEVRQRAAVEKAVKELTKNWANAPQVIVASSMLDSVIPQRVRDYNNQNSLNEAGSPEGFFYGGKAYLLADQLAQDDIARVLFHEVLGHAGLRGAFGDGLKPILQQMVAMRRQEVTAKAMEYRLDMTKEADRLMAAEEVLAVMAQTKPELGYVKRAIAVIRTWLRENIPGFKNLALTDAEIIQLYIIPARNFIERSRSGAISISRSVDTPSYQRASNGRVALPDSFGRLTQSLAFQNEGLDGLDVPSQRMVLSQVIAAMQDFKIADSVISLLPVDMVNVLTGQKFSTKVLFHDEAVLKHLLTISDSDKSITLAADSATALIKAVASVAANHRPGNGLGGNSLSGVSAVRANETDALGSSKRSTAAIAAEKQATKRIFNSAGGSIKFIGAKSTIQDRQFVTPISDGMLGAEGASTSSVPPILSRKQDQTNTPEFRRWFGDSKVVDADGKPLVVYHGTAEDIKEFSLTDGIKFDPGFLGQGFYFTSSPETARFYASNRASTGKAGPNSMPVYLSLKNPYYATVAEKIDGQLWGAKSDGPKARTQELIAKGYDGVVLDYTNGGYANETEYVVFNPEQIKSAIGNNGDFDPANPHIAFSRALAKAVTNTKDVKLPAGYLVGDFFNGAGKLNWWHKSVGTMYNLAQREPAFKRVYDGVQNFLNDVSYYATEAADLAPNILPKLDTWKDITKTPLSAADNKAIAAPIFEGTLVWGRDRRGQPVKMEVLEAEAAKLTTQQKATEMLRADAITEQVLKMWQGLPIAQYETLVESRYRSQMLQAGIVWKDDELKSQFKLTDGQIKLYREFRDATDKSLTSLAVSDMVRYGGKDVADIADAAMEAKTVEEASSMLRDYLMALSDGNERKDLLIDMAGRMIEKSDKARALMDKGYAPLSRFGTHSVDVVDAGGERVYFGLFESKAQATKMARRMAVEFPKATITQGTTSEQSYKLFAGVSPETLELFGEMLGLEAQGDDASSKAFQEYLKLARSSRSAMKRLIQRKGIAGFSEDPGRVLAGFVYSNARQASSGLHMGEIAESVNDIPQGQGQLKDAAIGLQNYIKNPQEEAQKFRGLLFAQYLGGSVASAAVNMTQPLTVTFPYLSQFGGIAKAAGQMRRAAADVMKKTTGDTELDAALKRAEEEGIVAPQEVHQLMAQANGSGSLKSGDGTKAGDAAAYAGNKLTQLGFVWGKLFSSAEQFNRRLTFIAAYRTAVEQKMGNPAAFAEKVIAETQFTYNKGSKPRWARGAIGGTLFTFKQYSVNYLELAHRMATQGGPEGKKAALLMVGVLMLMGGAGGLPFAEDAEDLVDAIMQRLGYSFSAKQKRNEFFQGLLGSEAARFLDTGISGLPGVPIDLSGRMGMGNLIPGTGLLVKKRDHTRDVVELAGPAGDLVRRGFESANKLAGGNVPGAAESLLPVAGRNLIKAMDMANTGMYRDEKGRKVIDTDAYDAFAKAIGFQPNTVARVQDASSTAMNLIGQNKLRETEIADAWALGMFEGDKAKVEKARADLKDWNDSNPDSPIKIQMPQIIKRVRAMRTSKEDRIAATAPKEIRASVKKELQRTD